MTGRRVEIEELIPMANGRWMGLACLGGPTRTRLMVVEFRGQLLAVVPFCPHNGLPLYKAKLIERPDDGVACLECPSHGWQLPLFGHPLQARKVDREADGRMLVHWRTMTAPDYAAESSAPCRM